MQFGISIRYAGHGGDYESIVVKGVGTNGEIVNEREALARKKFVAFYVKRHIVVAVATMMADPFAAKFAQRVKNHGYFRASDIDKFLKNELDEGRKTECVMS